MLAAASELRRDAAVEDVDGDDPERARRRGGLPVLSRRTYAAVMRVSFGALVSEVAVTRPLNYGKPGGQAPNSTLSVAPRSRPGATRSRGPGAGRSSARLP